ncbi:hypothetical protein NCAS_0H01460 [Naumovozyma castellii]|uniref:Ubiquitin-like protein ATG12 n=1 Tax=Naumovozyma castellii TaxID=27288 RepID=G0VIX9_NAUCA|nr:hypothetical protein NCAS_0H01460 [Naumovozyma castellii CBS 4309]CCC71456.1 hypothetical protein NCAS_0H01460 [Naumovozyma castellii CBS 4309]
MSRLLESEASSGSSGTDSDNSKVLDSHTPDNSVSRGQNNEIPSLALRNRLELYSRRLSQLGLEETPQIPLETDNTSLSQAEKEKIKNEEGPDVNSFKVKIKFQPIGSVPQIKPPVCKISATQSFSSIISFLRKRLRMENVYCYVNSSFAPTPQQNVGDLWTQFKVNDELIISYCGAVAFG